MKNKVKVLYRYEREYDLDLDGAEMHYKIRLVELNVVKHTPQGFWVVPKLFPFKKQKFVLDYTNEGNCKRFAYKTKQDAFNSFRKRTLKSIGYCKSALRNALHFVDKVNQHELCDRPIDLAPFEITNKEIHI